ncbi:hypothetical protein HU734_008825 [Pseudomonas wayambapalatensis]|uniref:hypothetical protein n=1 Tax=Pseudomonas TaxID=286 RepID=UPI001648B9B2|nr:hypothetical protein [Pseudomonas sp. RW3S2]MBC3420418.1 hypothetical protein [Pseudomonas sp. RW3S2]QXI44855.1 hypothetical protein HU734_008825 [Pseudomonas wayambapalatensis]
MTTPKSSDNFESASLETFKLKNQYKSSKYSKHHFELIEQGDSKYSSGFSKAISTGLGNQVLVVGQGSCVRIVFGEPVKDVAWVYHLDNPENVFNVTTELGGDKQTFGAGTITPLVTVGLGESKVEAIEIQATSAGSLHIDSLTWNKV